jgi:hypothetical protein
VLHQIAGCDAPKDDDDADNGNTANSRMIRSFPRRLNG